MASLVELGEIVKSKNAKAQIARLAPKTLGEVQERASGARPRYLDRDLKEANWLYRRQKAAQRGKTLAADKRYADNGAVKAQRRYEKGLANAKEHRAMARNIQDDFGRRPRSVPPTRRLKEALRRREWGIYGRQPE